jgi:hypothetical protein
LYRKSSVHKDGDFPIEVASFEKDRKSSTCQAGINLNLFAAQYSPPLRFTPEPQSESVTVSGEADRGDRPDLPRIRPMIKEQ